MCGDGGEGPGSGARHPVPVRAARSPWRGSRRYGQVHACSPYLLQRWNEGCTDAARLHAEIAELGFTGSKRTVRQHVTDAHGRTPPGSCPWTSSVSTPPTGRDPLLAAGRVHQAHKRHDRPPLRSAVEDHRHRPEPRPEQPVASHAFLADLLSEKSARPRGRSAGRSLRSASAGLCGGTRAGGERRAPLRSAAALVSARCVTGGALGVVPGARRFRRGPGRGGPSPVFLVEWIGRVRYRHCGVGRAGVGVHVTWRRREVRHGHVGHRGRHRVAVPGCRVRSRGGC